MIDGKQTAAATALAFVLALSAPALAQDFPARHISLVMPYAAGGPGDTIARIAAQGMSTHFKQQVVVENIAGAGGTLGSARIAAASPDGYSLLMIHVSAATNPALYPKMKYDQTKDFEPIGLVVELPSAFVARKGFPAGTFAELVAHVKANSDKVNYAHAGIGSASHLCGLLFAAATNSKFTQVPYRGTGPAMGDLLAGQVDFLCDQTVNVISNVKGGGIQGYAVTSKSRVSSLPDLPTAAEAGLQGFDLSIWYGIWAPKGTPKPVLDKLVAGLQAALKDGVVLDRLRAIGADAVSQERATPAALDAHLKAEIAKWGPIIRNAGIAAAQ